MKKKIIIVLVLVLIFIGIGTFRVLTEKSLDKSLLHEVKYDDFVKKIENRDSFALYVGSDECSHCAEYLPTLLSVVKKYNITLYYLDYGNLSEAESMNLTSYISISGTPTVCFITNGEEESTLNRIVGSISRESTIKRFELNGYIKNSK